jgi:hypothetical protein
MSRGTCSYICMYINAVVDSVMLYLWHDFYNIIFKIKQIIYSLRVSLPPPPNENFWLRTWCQIQVVRNNSVLLL